MSAEALMNTLSKLLVLHKSLHLIAKQKTEIIKVGDMDSLNTMLKEELKHIQAIKKLDKERENILNGSLGSDKHSFEDFLRLVSNPETKTKLLNVRNALFNEIKQLKKQNDLNQQLIAQSLQFVNVSLDLLLPDTEAVDYASNHGKDSEITRVSTFDFKA